MGYSGTNIDCAHAEIIGSFRESQFGQVIATLEGRNRMQLGQSLELSTPQPVSPKIIGDEVEWRLPPASSAMPSSRIHATRWRASEAGPRDVSAVTANDSYVVGLALRPMDVRLTVSDQVVQDGVAAAGMMHVSEPTTSARCLFRGPYDALHLHVPDTLLSECIDFAAAGNVARLHATPALQRDPVALQLGITLLKAEEFGTSFGWIYADGISLAIVTRLLALQAQGGQAAGRTEVAALAKWRLKRAIDFIEAHLDEPISLADVAAASGLSRMHFAAQFKAATGYRPHEYLLRYRIKKAQEILLASASPLAEVALQVGFQSQAHFTTVFKRFAGQPPHAWRQSRNPSGCFLG